MSFIRNVFSDLIEKRLWPIALLLVGALVAIPVLLGPSGGSEADTVASVPVVTTTQTTPTEIRVSEAESLSTLTPTGTKHNPFTQPKAAKAAQDPAPSASPEPASPPAAPASGGTGSGGGTSTPAPSTTPSGSTGTTKTPTGGDTTSDDGDTSAVRVDLRFGEPGVSKQKTYADIARLSALPNPDDPIVIFLGVKKDKKTVSFLISADATATGDGTCKPATTNCQTIEMRAGDTTFLDIDLGEGVRQFRLDVKRVGEVDKGTAKKASAARARTSAAGRAYLRSAIESGQLTLSGLGYSERSGVLTSAPKATGAGPLSRSAYRVDVKVGRMERKDVRRLQVLPERSRAKLLFLGVRANGGRASFLNLDDKPVQGASCMPSRADCRRLTLRTGRVAHVGGVRVKITRLKLRELASATAAEAARVREDDAGVELVAARGVDLTDLALNPATGTLAVSPL